MIIEIKKTLEILRLAQRLKKQLNISLSEAYIQAKEIISQNQS